MPLDKFVLLLVVVTAAAGLTVWIGSLVLAALQIPGLWIAFIPAALVGYVVWRVIADRIGSAEDDHYDHIEK
ncbi:hypothetical protein [Pseudoruegeria sp. HB172150]|uniref:hypothetical protein n=1 Tax=Pseudoruegeria sp. HB172150 TaxID=2721164 RepID=UPI0015540C71|nr:hypothetical protein [Pseudoruegeria sp. HB172150]